MRTRHLAAVTTGLTFVLLLVGVFTKEVGADLTCGMNWPLCDGAVFGLFPANLPSAVEWFHRLLALIVGVLVLYTLYRLWRERGLDDRVTRAVGVAVALLPFQAILGAITVTKAQFGLNSLLAGALISVAHYAFGVLLFTALVIGTVWAFEGGRPGSGTTHSTDAATADD
jgi:cytochrome c oxidase assembly protein subunit 15